MWTSAEILYDNPPCLISCALEKRPCTPDSGIPSLRSRNSRIGQGWKTAFIFPMLLYIVTTNTKDFDEAMKTIRPGPASVNKLDLWVITPLAPERKEMH